MKLHGIKIELANAKEMEGLVKKVQLIIVTR